MARHKITVDLTNKSATVTDTKGKVISAVGPGVTRSNAADKLAPHGWKPAGKWSLTSPPDGFECDAEPS